MNFRMAFKQHPMIFFTHFLSFHDSRLFCFPFFFIFIYFFSRPCSPCLCSTISYLVCSWSIPTHVPRPSSDLTIPSFLVASIPSLYPLFPVTGFSCYTLYLKLQLLSMYLFPDENGYTLMPLLTYTSASGPNCLIKTHLFLLQIHSHQLKEA